MMRKKQKTISQLHTINQTIKNKSNGKVQTQEWNRKSFC